MQWSVNSVTVMTVQKIVGKRQPTGEVAKVPVTLPRPHHGPGPSPRSGAAAYALGGTVFVHGGFGPSARMVLSGTQKYYLISS